MENFIYILKTVFTGICVEVCLIGSLEQLRHDPSSISNMLVVGMAVIFTLIFVKHSGIKWGSRS